MESNGSSADGSTNETGKLYLRRWWVLALFALLNFEQSAIWITFSTIAKPTMEFYHTTPSYINFLTALACIVFLIVVPITSWIVDKKGLKMTITVSAIICALGSSIRCFATGPDTFWLVIVGQTLNALVGPISMQVPPRMSSTWFGVHERTTATAIGSLAGVFGVAISFLLAFIVQRSSQVLLLVYIQSAFSILILLLILVYFPEKPPTPPTLSSSVMSSINETNRSMLADMKALLTNPAFLLITLTGGWSQGVSSGWMAVIDMSLDPLGFSQNDVGWLGFASVTAGTVGGVIVGRFTDRWLKKIKWIIVALFIASTLFFGWFTLMILRKIAYNYWLVLLSGVLAMLFLNAAQPLFFEISMEVTYPVSETTASGFLTFMMNVGTLIFLFADDYITPATMNWLTTGSVGASAVALLFLRAKYKRNAIDEGEDTEYTPINQSNK